MSSTDHGGGSADRSSRRSDRAPHVANFVIQMISGGGPAGADQIIAHPRIEHDLALLMLRIHGPARRF